MERCDVLIVGAGPTGLLLANQLGKRGIACVVVDRADDPPAESMAIGMMPPSLEILRPLDLDRAFVRHGLPVTRGYVHEEGRLLGCVRFEGIRSRYPFVLSLPQRATIQLLEEALERWPQVQLYRGMGLVGFREEGDRVVASLETPGAAMGTAAPSVSWRRSPPPRTDTGRVSPWQITSTRPGWGPKHTSSSAAGGRWNPFPCRATCDAGSC